MSELWSNRVAKDLMYIEAVAEVTGRWGGRGEGGLPHCRRKGRRKKW